MKESLKIAVFHCGFAYSGGGERLVLEEVMGLRRLGHEVVCFAPILDREACFPDFIDEVSVSTFLPQLPKWFPLRDALAMVLSSVLAPLLALRFREVEVFVGANQPGAWIAYCMAKVLRKPYVVYMNQPNRLLYPRQIDGETGWGTNADYRFLDFMTRRFKRFATWADHASYTGATEILVNGGHIADVIAERYGREVTICPAGCHPQTRRLLRLYDTTKTDGAFKLNGHIIEQPFILITNRHEPQKKFEDIIFAFSRIGDDVPAATLVIPGPFTSHTSHLIELADDLAIGDRVHFLGQVLEADLQRLYREAAVYCYPAPEEDFGMGVIEAMAWGVPVVAWNNAGPTVTVVDGETGFLAEPNDIQGFGNSIAWLLQDPELRIRLGKAGWDRARQKYSWEQHFGILDQAVINATRAVDIGAPITEAFSQTAAYELITQELPAYVPAPPSWAEAETEPQITDWREKVDG